MEFSAAILSHLASFHGNGIILLAVYGSICHTAPGMSLKRVVNASMDSTHSAFRLCINAAE